jgi:hypothetical protein
MRFAGIDTVSFSALDGKTYPVKGFREIPVYTMAMKVSCDATTMLDEIASRTDIWGRNAEGLAYKIFEANMLEIVERKYDLKKLKKLIIPI